MDREGFNQLWSDTVCNSRAKPQDYERLAQSVLDLYHAGDENFRRHIANRSGSVAKATGQTFDALNFDLSMARAFIADEIGFNSWDKLIAAVRDPEGRRYPIVFEYAIAALWRGDFTSLETTIGGPRRFNEQVIEWFDNGYFENEPDTLAEIFSAACMLGHPRAVEYLLDRGVDPYAGMRTGLSGFHYAASSGRLEVIKLLIGRRVPMEVKNMYGGTVFGQAMWSAVNEYTPYHVEIVKRLIEAGAAVDDGYESWWKEQNVPSPDAKRQIAEMLRNYKEFYSRLENARREVEKAESLGDKLALADALKALGNILRRPPFGRDEANQVYTRAADMYRELDRPLDEAWIKRHIGINHEYAGRLTEAERLYDEALSLYRKHSKTDDLNYANAVRYPAVIKERLGNIEDSARLWEEAHDRYAKVHPNGLGEGVAEAAAWLTIFAINAGDRERAEEWLARAAEASRKSQDADTHKFVAKVKRHFEEKFDG
jgi:tetratricopeptide (TPR) repeat protein